MRFPWTEEQNILISTLRKYVSDQFSFEDRHRRIAAGFNQGAWLELAEMGILGLPFDEKYGGSGGSALDTFIVMEAFGRGLAVEPYIPTVVLGGGLLRHAANESQKSEYIPSLISGEMRLAFAFAEQQSRFNLANVATLARKDGGDYILNGHKIVVFGAAECHQVLVTARTAGHTKDSEGISLFLVPVGTKGLEIRSYTCLDGTTAAEVILREVRIPGENLIGECDHILPSIEETLDEAISAICAEAVGAMAALNEKCVEYSKVREAFGQPIANFQVIGHRLVDMHVSYEQAFALCVKAAQKISVGAPDCAQIVSACKVLVGQEAGSVGKHAVQLHGAMGITDELDIGHYFKRILAIQTMFGTPDFHLRRFVELGDLTRLNQKDCNGH